MEGGSKDLNGKPWDEVRNQTERGKQKTNMERQCLLGKRAPAFEKTKTKQMQRCNLPRFKTNRRTRGSGNHAIPYFEGFTTAAVCQNQSGRSPFRGTKTNGTLIAALQKPEGGLRHTEGRQIADFGTFLCQEWKQGSTGRSEGMREADMQTGISFCGILR